eukprot:m.198338 g.198338  ORF g.198338 m.198338 type:complete len:61 (-) comp18742_c0_seq1:1103-1285(-)
MSKFIDVLTPTLTTTDTRQHPCIRAHDGSSRPWHNYQRCGAQHSYWQPLPDVFAGASSRT